MSRSLNSSSSSTSLNLDSLDHRPLVPFYKSDVFLVIAGSAVAAVISYGIYMKFLMAKKSQGRQETPPAAAAGINQSPSERAKIHIKKELERLKHPKLLEDPPSGGYDSVPILQRKDFFDLLFLIQLKSKLKLQKEVGRNQRERVKILQQALTVPKMSQYQTREQTEKIQLATYENYIVKASQTMQNELDQYEDQFAKILNLVGISNDTWESSRDFYISGDQMESVDLQQQQLIESIDKRVYEYLSQPTIPKSLTRDQVKQILIDVNHRSAQVFKNLLRHSVNDIYPTEYEPLLMETLAFDLAFVEYGVNESVLRFATHKYELQRDNEIKEQLEVYLSS